MLGPDPDQQRRMAGEMDRSIEQIERETSAVLKRLVVRWGIRWAVVFAVIFLLTQSVDSQTLPVGIALMQGGREVMFGQMAAASLAGLIPVYLLALFLQKWLICGLTQGSVK